VKNRIQWFSAVRALGLVLVLVYHFFYELLPGGFLGVDLFFTFSGYLITALAIAEFRKTGGFALGAFWKRRFLRTAPPLLICILLTLPLALLVSPDFTANILKQAASVLGFVSNYFEIRTGGSYEANVLPHLYLHTWTLSVEVHLYLVWGLVCAALALLLRHGRVPRYAGTKNAERAHSRFGQGVFAVSVLMATWSYIAMQRAYQPGADSSAAYFSSTAHAFPFFIGAAAATLVGLRVGPRLQRFLQRKSAKGLCIAGFAASALGIAALALLLRFTDAFVYRYGFLAASLLATCAIVCARGLHEALPGKQEPKALTVLADLSYSIYLYHWPLYIIFSALLPNNNLAALASFALSFVLSALVFYRIEPLLLGAAQAKPTRRGRPRAKRRFPALTVFALACALVAGAATRRIRLHRKRWIAAALAVPALACVVLCGMAVRRAPALTSIEEKLYAGYMLQDMDALAARKEWLDSVNDAPVRFGGEIVAMAELREDAPPPERAPGVPVLSPVEVGGGVTILGDSITVDARASLIEAIPNCAVDALSSRNLAEGYGIMMDMQAKGTLREILVVALGVNGVDEFAEYIQKIIDDLAPGHKLVFVTPYDGRTPAGRAYRTAVAERELAAPYDFVTIADWHADISKQEGLLAGDKVHLGAPASRQIYIGHIAEAVRTASQGPGKG